MSRNVSTAHVRYRNPLSDVQGAKVERLSAHITQRILPDTETPFELSSTIRNSSTISKIENENAANKRTVFSPNC